MAMLFVLEKFKKQKKKTIQNFLKGLTSIVKSTKSTLKIERNLTEIIYTILWANNSREVFLSQMLNWYAKIFLKKFEQ